MARVLKMTTRRKKSKVGFLSCRGTFKGKSAGIRGGTCNTSITNTTHLYGYTVAIRRVHDEEKKVFASHISEMPSMSLVIPPPPGCLQVPPPPPERFLQRAAVLLLPGAAPARSAGRIPLVQLLLLVTNLNVRF